MKIIITERQLKTLKEQTKVNPTYTNVSAANAQAMKNYATQVAAKGTTPTTQTTTKPVQKTTTQPTSTNLNLKGKVATNIPKKIELTPEQIKADQELAHRTNTIMAIGSSFIPIVGPFVSAGINLADAAMYADEGDYVSAGVVGAFAMLPYVGSVVSKIPGVKQLGQKGMEALASKIVKGVPITDATELAVMQGINLNKELVEGGLSEYVKSVASQTTKKVGGGLLDTLNKIAEKGLEIAVDDYKQNKTIEYIKGVTGAA